MSVRHPAKSGCLWRRTNREGDAQKSMADGSVATLKPGSPTEIIEGAAANERNERSTLLAGLLAPTPRISQVYLYDARGSELYEEIVRAPEYYLPDTESLLLSALSVADPRSEPVPSLSASISNLQDKKRRIA